MSLVGLPRKNNAYRVFNILILLVFNVIMFAPNIYAQEPEEIVLSHPNKIITTKDGLISNKVYGCLQDREGYMWFYTDKGVSKYDGHRFKNFTMKDGLPNQDVWLMTLDSDNKLWLHTHDNVLAYIKNDSVHRLFTFPKKLYITLIQEDKKGNLYFNDALNDFTLLKNKNNYNTYIYVNDSIHKYSRTPQVGSGKIYKIGEYNHFQSSAFDRYYIQKPCSDSFNYIILKKPQSVFYTPEIRDSFVYISSSEGLMILDKDQLVKKITINISPIIHRSFIDFKNNVWVSTNGSGVYAFWNISTNSVDVKSQFDNDFQKVYITKNKKIIVENSTKSQIISKTFTNYSTNFFGIKKILNWFRDSFLVLDNTGYWKCNDDYRKISSKSLGKSFNANILNSLSATISINNDSIIGVYIDNICNLLTLKDNHLESRIFHSDSFRIKELLIDSLKNIYIFSKNQYYKYNSKLQLENTFSLYANNNLLNITCGLINKISNRPIVGTFEQGIYYQDRLFNWKLISNTIDLEIRSLNYCGDYITVLTNKGIYILKSYGEELRIGNVYSSSCGLIPEEIISSYTDDSLIFCITKNSIISIKPNIENVSTYKIYLTGIECDRSIIQPDDLMKLKPDNKNIKIGLSILQYSKSDDVSYSYKLHENDNWTNLSTNELFLNTLVAGKYNLQIEAKNKYSGEIFAMRTIPIFVYQFWYKSWWFILFVNALVLSTIFLIYSNWVKRRLSTQEKFNKLETNLKEVKLQALEAQMNPHFVFNSITAIQYYLQENRFDFAEIYLTRFSKLIRAYLEAARNSTILLSNEITLLTKYLELEKMRHNDKFEFFIQEGKNLNSPNIEIPTMLIQPFVENAIRHGLHFRISGAKLWINFTHQENILIIQIKDNGIGITESKIKTYNKNKENISRALEIFNEKIEIYNKLNVYNISMNIDFLNPDQTEFKGTLVEIRIQFLDKTINLEAKLEDLEE